MLSHRKLRQEANSIAFDHQPQKHVLRTVDDVELELVASVLMTASHNVERSPLIFTTKSDKYVRASPSTCLIDQSAHFEMYHLCDWQPVQHIIHKFNDVIESGTSRHHTISVYQHLKSMYLKYRGVQVKCIKVVMILFKYI